MKVNKKLLPIKAHYFCFLGCVAPILPFLMVVAVQLGMPVSVMGSLTAFLLCSVVLIKPVLAALADAFPSYRRLLFLGALTIMVVAYCSIYFIPPMKEAGRLEGRLVRVKESGSAVVLVAPAGEEGGQASQRDGDCYIARAWDCVALCSDPWACLSSNASSSTSPQIKITALSPDLAARDGEEDAHGPTEWPEWGSGGGPQPPDTGDARLYQMDGINVSSDMIGSNISVACVGREWRGAACQGVWNYWSFWLFALLLMLGQMGFNVGVSVTDAIIVDIIGENGDYGVQRAWGTVGWGLMGPVSGFLIDWYSGTSLTKDYAPAFLICFILGSLDILLSAASIKVPEIKTEHDLMTKVWPLLRHPRVFIFCLFAIMNGCFDGCVASYIFIMQEDMARGTDAMSYMKFLQGLTLFVQCGIEAPFMFINNWFMRRLGAQHVLSLVFFLYIFRLLGLAAVGAYGPVWATLVVEILNGPCYGLGYTAIVVYSSKIAPPGTSTTVQSVVNICYESLGYALAAFVGGLVYNAWGGPRLYLVAGVISVVTCVLHFLSVKFLPPLDRTDGEDLQAEKADQAAMLMNREPSDLKQADDQLQVAEVEESQQMI